jgi:hypothetical protein
MRAKDCTTLELGVAKEGIYIEQMFGAMTPNLPLEEFAVWQIR